MVRAVDINEAFEGISIVRLQSAEPQDASKDQIIFLWTEFIDPTADRFTALENSIQRSPVSMFFRDLKGSQGGSEAAFLAPGAEHRCRHRIRVDQLATPPNLQLLVRNDDPKNVWLHGYN